MWVTWGDSQFGADSSGVQDQLQHVIQVESSYGAFAAILEDRTVVTWGDLECGGDSSDVKDQLQNVQQIVSTKLLCCTTQKWKSGNMGLPTSLVVTVVKSKINCDMLPT